MTKNQWFGLLDENVQYNLTCYKFLLTKTKLK